MSKVNAISAAQESKKPTEFGDPGWALSQKGDPGQKRYAVIGAGASGICMAKHLLEVGLDVTIFEIGTHIGGRETR